jgi:hypothetical protein
MTYKKESISDLEEQDTVNVHFHVVDALEA